MGESIKKIVDPISIIASKDHGYRAPISIVNVDSISIGSFIQQPYTIKAAYFQPPYTTVKWMDDTVTTVRCADDDEYDRERGVLLCFAKRLFGGGWYNDALRKALGEDE
jgi:hypothetical protein